MPGKSSDKPQPSRSRLGTVLRLLNSTAPEYTSVADDTPAIRAQRCSKHIELHDPYYALVRKQYEADPSRFRVDTFGPPPPYNPSPPPPPPAYAP